jgi:hypothetical protein
MRSQNSHEVGNVGACQSERQGHEPARQRFAGAEGDDVLRGDSRQIEQTVFAPAVGQILGGTLTDQADDELVKASILREAEEPTAVVVVCQSGLTQSITSLGDTGHSCHPFLQITPPVILGGKT